MKTLKTIVTATATVALLAAGYAFVDGALLSKQQQAACAVERLFPNFPEWYRKKKLADLMQVWHGEEGLEAVFDSVSTWHATQQYFFFHDMSLLHDIWYPCFINH